MAILGSPALQPTKNGLGSSCNHQISLYLALKKPEPSEGFKDLNLLRALSEVAHLGEHINWKPVPFAGTARALGSSSTASWPCACQPLQPKAPFLQEAAALLCLCWWAALRWARNRGLSSPSTERAARFLLLTLKQCPLPTEAASHPPSLGRTVRGMCAAHVALALL